MRFSQWLTDIVRDATVLAPHLGHRIEYQNDGLVAQPMHLLDMVTFVRGGREELQRFWQPVMSYTINFNDPWLKWVEIVSRRLFAKTSWVYYLHHLLTPMHTNHCPEIDEQRDRVALWHRLQPTANRGTVEWAADRCLKRARSYTASVPTDWCFYPGRVIPREVLS